MLPIIVALLLSNGQVWGQEIEAHELYLSCNDFLNISIPVEDKCANSHKLRLKINAGRANENQHTKIECEEIILLEINDCPGSEQVLEKLLSRTSIIEEITIKGSIPIFAFDWIGSSNLSTIVLDNNNPLELKGEVILELQEFSCVACNLSKKSLEVLKQFNTSLTGLNLLQNERIEDASLSDLFPNLNLLNGKDVNKKIVNDSISSISDGPRIATEGNHVVNDTSLNVDVHSESDDKKAPSTSSAVDKLCLSMFLSIPLILITSKRLALILTFIGIITSASTLPLQTIELTSDHLNDVPRNITALDLHEKGISYIRHSTFWDFENLKRLDLSRNKLKELHITSNSLIVLDLSDNCIEHFKAISFKSFSNLRQLYLKNNRLRDISWDISFHENLKDLVLSYNELATLKIISPSLEILKIKNNRRNVVISPETQMGNLTRIDAQFTDWTLSTDICTISMKKLAVLEGTLKEKICERSSRLIEADVILPQNKGGCDFSTLKIGVNDVVMTKDEYNTIMLTYYVTLMGGVFWLLLIIFVIIWLLRNNTKIH